MDFIDWEPHYTKILNTFGFSQEKDEQTALWLSNEFNKISGSEKRERNETLSSLKYKISRQKIVVCGNAPSLEKEYSLLSKSGDEIYIAADGAASVLLQNGRVPEIIVTDLDGKHSGDAMTEIEAADKGAMLLIHAHGDNFDKLEKYLPALSDKIKKNAVVPTCQCRPLENLFNFGGFTDGDRCVFLADAFDAASVILIGFDFNDFDATPLKKKKLKCAEKLIQILRRKNPGKIKFTEEI
ncbi:MAG: DUF115 domain-containing protein [Methanosarcinales archaeon]|jgi:uncharacterized Rossmann fold enzyme|nr:DUF115 domain-containing protein [Methanosarcinales archaeon]